MLLRPMAVAASLVVLVGIFPVSSARGATGPSSRNVPTNIAINDFAGMVGSYDQEGAYGLAVGHGGYLATTTDGGRTWTKRTTGTTAALFAAGYLSLGRVYEGYHPCGYVENGVHDGGGCMWAGGAHGTLLFSNDGGRSWCRQDTGTSATIHSILITGSERAIAAVGSDGTLIVTDMTDGRPGTANLCGAAARYRRVETGTASDLYDIDAGASGFFISGAGGTLLLATWGSSPGEDMVATLASGTTADLNGVAAVGINGQSPMSGIGGTPPDPGRPSDDLVIAVGDHGTIVRGMPRYWDGDSYVFNGLPLTPQDSGTTVTLHDVELGADHSNVPLFAWAVGDLGTILESDPGLFRESQVGERWTPAASGTCKDLLSNSWHRVGQLAFTSGDRGTVLIEDMDDTDETVTVDLDCIATPHGGNGYRMVATDGGVFTFGSRAFHGSTGDLRLNAPIVGGATDTSDYDGYWLVAADGGVFAFDAAFHGALAGQGLAAPPVAIEPSPTGQGYWVVLGNGAVHAFGDATFVGDLGGMRLNRPITGMSTTPTGMGYWLVAEDGGVFAFGDADHFGSMGGETLNAPVIDLAPAPDSQGYFLLGRDGGIFTFGSAEFQGSTGAMELNAPVIGMLVASSGGYRLAASDGGVFTFGPVDFLGSLGGAPLNAPVLDLID